ncbi:uncharacterized protein K489DRAFT_385415 [Dissoconium aciculare CBS 342.82]|uniref:NYN domain-containing protein n=1 Tax=Dissoconium aciculare CBS 342.82 TaxID=1314786 RepID=A0A6J3LPS0_9PEZI|nr:uncharacterized protein K489DRAFT_385415 [Dissoconium aciculare CBS 342.82]KAF1817926.1 hypothetical protein K489DRAFT_385415 [Dissoconium aciculare CBS 342.82]
MALSLGDFSRVLDITKQHEPLFLKDWDVSLLPATPSRDVEQLPGLGNFGDVWSFLGSPALSEPATPAALSTPLVNCALDLPPKQTKQGKPKLLAQSVQKPADKTQAVNTQAAKISNTPVTKAGSATPKKKKVTPQRPASPLFPKAPATAPAKVNAKAQTTITRDTTATNKLPLSVLKDASVTAPNTPTPKPKLAFLPASVQPLAGGGRPMQTEHRIKKPISQTPRSIEPKVARAPEDKDWDLFTRIMKNFPEDRKTLVAPMNLTTHNNDPNGVHIFVDASNIFIGFMKEMKLSRGIPDHVRIPRADLSFDSLALLMERRRPVAKRVLVGSTPHLPAFDKAKAVGYQCSILEKVEKARQLTERQVYFKEQEEARKLKSPYRSKSSRAQYSSGNTSGSDTGTASAPQFDRVKMVEQGVDEILHLKICESVLDHPGKPGTIVLATGDAAEAEYSDGFLKTLERALKHGWTVELLSWSRSISALYTKRSWSKQWGDRFRIIPLDEYAEDLLDMSIASA